MSEPVVIVQINGRGGVTIPKSLRAGVRTGSLFEVVRREDGVIELRPKAAVDVSQAWFWSERWQQMEREAQADIEQGRVNRADDLESFLSELDR